MDFKTEIKRNFGEFYLKISLEDDIIANRLEQFVYNKLGAKDMTRLWESKYNDYVVYDYKPFCTEGFYKVLNCCFKSFNETKYAEYEVAKYLKNLSQLEKIYKENIDLETELGKRVKELQEV